MKKRWFCTVAAAVLGGVLIWAACAPAAAPVVPTPATVKALAEVSERPAWQVKWDELVREARKEGNVSVYASSVSPGEKRALQQGMRDKFEILLEMLIMPQTAFVAKLEAERRAGIFSTDVWVSGPSTLTTIMRPRGLIDPLDDVLILPDVVDRKNWISKEGVFFDKEHMIIGGFATPSLSIFVNTKLVNRGEIKGWADLLDPKWKGKIVMLDSSIPGTASGTVVSMVLVMGEDYLRQLARQEPVITRSTRDHMEWVVKGKYPVGVGGAGSQLKQFIDAGAGDLVEAIPPVEGTSAGTGGHSMAMINRSPHPNAARVFLNWAQTREIQTVMARESGNASRRVDVKNDWLEGYTVVKPGMKIIEVTEEVEAKFAEYAQLFARIFLSPEK